MKFPLPFNLRHRVLAVLFLVLLMGCSKEDNPNEIPYVALNFVILPNSTEYLELNGVGGWVYLTGGYRGIVVYRKSMDEFVAFDRACPYDWELADARIDMESSGLTLVCPSCKSKYIILDGTPFEGPSHYPMKQYQTHYDGSQLYISN